MVDLESYHTYHELLVSIARHTCENKYILINYFGFETWFAPSTCRCLGAKYIPIQICWVLFKTKTTNAFFFFSNTSGCIMKASSRACKADDRFTTHGTCTHDHIQVAGYGPLKARASRCIALAHTHPHVPVLLKYSPALMLGLHVLHTSKLGGGDQHPNHFSFILFGGGGSELSPSLYKTKSWGWSKSTLMRFFTFPWNPHLTYLSIELGADCRCEKLGAYYAFRGTRVGHNKRLTGVDQYFDGKLHMTDTACMQACSKLVDPAGNNICKCK